MRKNQRRLWQTAAFTALALGLTNCRNDPGTGTQSPVSQFGSPGNGYTVQCSGWFPDWISPNPPEIADAFQLSQGYPLGNPVFENGEHTGWEPLDPPQSRPWMAFDYTDPTEADAYAHALLDYAFTGLRRYDWDPNNRRGSGIGEKPNWFHAPFMHTSPNSRREPLKGVTSERGLRPNENSWVTGFLRTYAVGYYDYTAGYTLGQIYNDPDPGMADATATEFLGNAYIFKLIFAEYDPSKIDATDPLANSPEWQIQDVQDPNGPLINIRLIQVDVAVKDPRASADTGWVFATFAYDKSINPPDGDPWRRLQPVGLQWGSDENAPPFGNAAVQESWINPNLLQIWEDRLGRGDRLNGPIDNPESSCMSCHSTAQIDPTVRSGNGSLVEFSATRMAPDNCNNAQLQDWYRNLPNQDTFGDYDNRCTAQPNNNLVSLDYSLQVMVGLQSALYYGNANPCAAQAKSALVTQSDMKSLSIDRREVVDTRNSEILFEKSRELPTLQLEYSEQVYSSKDGIKD